MAEELNGELDEPADLPAVQPEQWVHHAADLDRGVACEPLVGGYPFDADTRVDRLRRLLGVADREEPDPALLRAAERTLSARTPYLPPPLESWIYAREHSWKLNAPEDVLEWMRYPDSDVVIGRRGIVVATFDGVTVGSSAVVSIEFAVGPGPGMIRVSSGSPVVTQDFAFSGQTQQTVDVVVRAAETPVYVRIRPLGTFDYFRLLRISYTPI